MSTFPRLVHNQRKMKARKRERNEEMATGITYRDVQLTNAQLLTLPTTPVELVPAPGAGAALVFHSAYVVQAFTTGYGNRSAGTPSPGDHGMLLVYGNDDADASCCMDHNSFFGSTEVLQAILPPTLVLASTVVTDGFLDSPSLIEGGAKIDLTNKSLRLIARNALGDFTGGHASNTLSIRVWYSTVSTLPFS